MEAYELFFTEIIGGYSESEQGTNISALSKNSNTGLIPSTTSCLSGYRVYLGQKFRVKLGVQPALGVLGLGIHLL